MPAAHTASHASTMPAAHTASHASTMPAAAATTAPAASARECR
jgi:hypothetical protein